MVSHTHRFLSILEKIIQVHSKFQQSICAPVYKILIYQNTSFIFQLLIDKLIWIKCLSLILLLSEEQN